MIKSCNYLTTVIFLFLATSLFGQENSVKIGFTDAFLGHYNLNYERHLTGNNSVQFKIGFLKPTSSPFISDETITPSAYVLENSKGGLNTSLEYRFYVNSEEAGTGFYVAPYLRYLNQKMNYSDEIDGNNYGVDFKVNLLGAGAQLGYQLILEERFILDFYFFGAGLDYYMVNMKYQLKQPDPGFNYSSITDDVSEVFEDINYLHKKLDHNVNNDNLLTKLPFFFPGFRIGVNAGFIF